LLDIPGYRILRPLGKGGMATVYLAVQESLAREVALKILAPALAEDATARQRFLREARTAAQLHHPNIIAIHDVGTYADGAYMAMDFEGSGTAAPVTGTALHCQPMLRCALSAIQPWRSTMPTPTASCIAISSPRIFSCGPTARLC
jgi:serine/threonine-protein kinase PpkA